MTTPNTRAPFDTTLVWQGLAFPPYEQMVKDLFKKLPTIGEEAHHATTGIAGEVGELSEACSRENILEELGDLEFYVEALVQKLDSPLILPEGMQFSGSTFGTSIIHLHSMASRMLDLSKKSWIYGRPLPVEHLRIEAGQFRQVLEGLYGYLGTTQDEVRHLNQVKLMKRYPTGYTNEAAIERADKS